MQKNSNLFFLFGLLVLLPANVYTQTLEWAFNIGQSESSIGGVSDNSFDIALDSLENVYIVGQFARTVDFDSSIATFELTSIDNSNDIFTAKYDKSGNFIWAKKSGAQYSDVGRSITVDYLGNVLMTGSVTGDLLIEKRTSEGDLIWAKMMNGGSGRSIKTDENGNIYVTGDFIEELESEDGETLITGVGESSDIFLMKLEPNGDLCWINPIGGQGTDAAGPIVLDSIGNIYLTGSYKQSLYFNNSDIGLETSNGSTIFVSKMDNNGNLTWAKSMGSSDDDSGNSIVVDKLGNIYMTGSFGWTADFDPSDDVYELFPLSDDNLFTVKLSSEGDLIWARGVGDVSQISFGGSSLGYSITIDNEGNSYTIGSFGGPVDFDPSENIFTLFQEGAGRDIFIRKLDSEGNFIWAIKVGGEGYTSNWGNAIIWSHSDYLYSTGRFEKTVDFDPQASVFELSSNFFQDHDAFILKLNNETVISGIHQWEENAPFKVFPNPSSGIIDFQFPQETYITELSIINSTGVVVFIRKDIGYSHSMNLSSYPSGLYNIILTDKSGKSHQQKFLIP